MSVYLCLPSFWVLPDVSLLLGERCRFDLRLFASQSDELPLPVSGECRLAVAARRSPVPLGPAIAAAGVPAFAEALPVHDDPGRASLGRSPEKRLATGCADRWSRRAHFVCPLLMSQTHYGGLSNIRMELEGNY